ncbi:hypothetical protein TI39_contig498g00010 [Zymoseptoria brevis]|uniref:DUF7587 domain-containing protein n=1 Tax=Zymoseptoria brevis TaxID=1047168 RepID=A0A0F4GMG2_9PEZI|nr:hypothetical protein TI39_contig498g00010 [Zymoseptoria brevis]
MAFTANQKRKLTPTTHKLTWSHEMRVVLYMIFEEFVFDKAKKKEIFDTIFREHIAKCGLTDGVPFSRLTVQLSERRKHVANWTIVCQPPASDAEKRLRAELKQKIENVARFEATQACQDERQVQGGSSAHRGTSRAHASQVAEASNSEVPLSAQAAIGHWQPDTPIASRGKRSRRDSAAAPRPKRQQLNEMVLAQGTILHHRQLNRQGASTSTSTRKASSSSGLARTPTKIVRKMIPKSPRTRRDGTVIRIPDQEEINVEVAPVSQHLAQPDLPELLFRWWKKDPECDRDSENGFWSRKHHKSNAIPLTPPKACSIDATDILNHLDRKTKETPFISTTDRLLWIVQRIIKGIQAGQEDMYLSVISVKELDPRAVFHARAFHDAVRPTRGFSNGAQNYRGCSEWLVWRDIPKRAIIHTFEATELIDMIDSNPGIASVLRLEVLRGRECLNTKKVPLLRRHKIALSADTIPAIANVAIFLGLNAHSAMEHITHIVRDIVEGWGLTLKKQTEQDWQHLAGVFEEEFCRHSPSPITLRTRVCVQTAFLSGVAAGTGKVNYRFKSDLLPQQQERAALLGLASPAVVVAHSLDGAKLTVLAREKAQQRRLLQSQAPLQPLLEDTQTLYGEDQDEGVLNGDEPGHHAPPEDANDDDMFNPIKRRSEKVTRQPAPSTRLSVEQGDIEAVAKPAERHRPRHRHRPRSRSPQDQRQRKHPRRAQPTFAVGDDSEDELIAEYRRASQPRQAVPMTPPTTDPAGEESDGEGILYVESGESDGEFDDENDEWT